MRRLFYTSILSVFALVSAMGQEETQDTPKEIQDAPKETRSTSKDTRDTQYTFKNTQKTSKKTFTSADKKYNDWSLSLFAGTSMIQTGDLKSYMIESGGWVLPGYDFQFSVNKQISHAFALSINYQHGQTSQRGSVANYAPAGWAGGLLNGKTTYNGVSIIGDVNISNLLRRVDNRSEFKWAVHAYAGAGILQYKAKTKMKGGSDAWFTDDVNDQKFDFNSVYGQAGLGLRYKLNQKLDLELKGMYVVTGDEKFDGSGLPNPGHVTPADAHASRSDNFMTLSIGVHYKLGKHEESLQWHDPLVGMRSGAATAQVQPFECIDKDNDGVCDQWDRCPDTPEGVRVDGAGCSLDSDKDGTPDSLDDCPTVAGPPTNKGCPIATVQVTIEEIAKLLTTTIQGVEFDYNSDKIRTVSYTQLNLAATIMNDHPTYKFYVEGHTDAAGNAAYNQTLSEKRANSVVRYLVNKSVAEDRLIAIGKGKMELKNPECNPTSNCTPAKNLENRRVIFKAIQ